VTFLIPSSSGCASAAPSCNIALRQKSACSYAIFPDVGLDNQRVFIISFHHSSIYVICAAAMCLSTILDQHMLTPPPHLCAVKNTKKEKKETFRFYHDKRLVCVHFKYVQKNVHSPCFCGARCECEFDCIGSASELYLLSLK